MALIQGGHWQRFLQKYFGIKGEIVAPEVGPEIHPVIPVTGLPMELRFLDGVTTWVAEINTTGDATHPGQVGLCNFSNTNVQAKVLSAIAYYTPSVVGTPLSWAIIASRNAASARGFCLDSRARTVFSTRSVCVTNSLATIGSLGLTQSRPIGQPVTGSQIHQIVAPCGRELVLNPGEDLWINTGGNTEFLSVQFYWTERFLDPSEITA